VPTSRVEEFEHGLSCATGSSSDHVATNHIAVEGERQHRFRRRAPTHIARLRLSSSARNGPAGPRADLSLPTRSTALTRSSSHRRHPVSTIAERFFGRREIDVNPQSAACIEKPTPPHGEGGHVPSGQTGVPETCDALANRLGGEKTASPIRRRAGWRHDDDPLFMIAFLLLLLASSNALSACRSVSNH